MFCGVTGGDDRTISLAELTASHELDIDAPHLVRIIESACPLASPTRVALVGVEELRIGRGATRVRAQRGAELELTIPDEWMSSAHARLARGAGGWTVEDLGSKNGLLVNGARVATATLIDGDVLEAGGTMFLFRHAPASMSQLASLDADAPRELSPALATFSLELERRLASLEAAAQTELPILISGETGTGKELAARAIHTRSGRRGPLQAVNCGALPAELVESELFGSRRGAFSGALDRPGHIRAAHGGTLFLDEIAELPEAAQASLLRVLQEREVTPLGESRPTPVDLRVVAACQRPLAELVRAGRFRADLYARLAGLEIELLPLRARREDFGLILGSLLRRHAGERAEAVRFRRSAMRALITYDWPHNIRELDRAVAAALALAHDRPVGLIDLPRPIREHAAGKALSDEDRALRTALVEALTRSRGNVSATARELGKAREQIRRWCKRLGVDPQRFRR
jgi:transcriptional regulator with PAS, ATPase and Fis domain